MEQRTVNLELKTSRRKVLRQNASKFLFIAWTLDRLVQYLMYNKAERINIGYIDKSIYKSRLLKHCKESEENVNYWIQEMIFIGLIRLETDPVINQELVYLTPKGADAYKSQTYHIIAANLLEASESRRMARWAVIIALVSVAISILLAFLIR